jgi:hypothetical protein
MDRIRKTVALKPSAVDGTTIKVPAVSCAVRTQWQETSNQARKALVPETPELRMGFLLRRSPAGTQVLAT